MNKLNSISTAEISKFLLPKKNLSEFQILSKEIQESSQTDNTSIQNREKLINYLKGHSL